MKYAKITPEGDLKLFNDKLCTSPATVMDMQRAYDENGNFQYKVVDSGILQEFGVFVERPAS